MPVPSDTPAAEPRAQSATVPSITSLPPVRQPYPPAKLLPGTHYLGFRRAAECILAGIFLVVTAPLMLLASLLVKLTSRGPVFYTQVRVGQGGRPFTIYKLRTMKHDCERRSGPCWAARHDSRVTVVGWLLRRTHIDELPQLWNVLRGDMSLIGPRPERPEFVPQLEIVIPLYRERLRVRPGLTGLAQVQLPADTDLTSVRRKLACDLYYIQQVGAWLDLRILLATVCYLLCLPFAVSRFLFRVPAGMPVEHAYQSLVSGAETVTDLPVVV